MFFGQEVKTNQNKANSLTMERDVKLSQAVLDPATKGNKKEPVCLMAEIQGKSFILAVLDPAQSWQCPLDLVLTAGTEVKFYLRGQGTIHLTGYEFTDDEFEMSMSTDDEMEEEEGERAAQLNHAAKKLKTKNSPTKINGFKSSNQLVPSGDRRESDDDDSDDEDLSFGSDDDSHGDSDDSDMDDVDLDDSDSDGSDEDEDEVNGEDEDEDEDDDDDDDDEDDDDDDDDEESD